MSHHIQSNIWPVHEKLSLEEKAHSRNCQWRCKKKEEMEQCQRNFNRDTGPLNHCWTDISIFLSASLASILDFHTIYRSLCVLTKPWIVSLQQCYDPDCEYSSIDIQSLDSDWKDNPSVLKVYICLKVRNWGI